MNYKIAENIAHRTLEKEVVVLNLKNGLYYVLNDTASRIWEWLFVSKYNISKVVSSMSSEYNMDDKEQIKKDVEAQLSFWQAENLIEKSS